MFILCFIFAYIVYFHSIFYILSILPLSPTCAGPRGTVALLKSVLRTYERYEQTDITICVAADHLSSDQYSNMYDHDYRKFTYQLIYHLIRISNYCYVLCNHVVRKTYFRYKLVFIFFFK